MTRRRPFRFALAVCLPLVTLIGCRPGEAETTVAPVAGPPEVDGPVWFRDVTEDMGLRFTHDPGEEGAYFTPQSVGSGCAFLDYDQDGRLDIYLLHNGGPTGKKNQLFRQTEGGKFEDVSEGSGLDVAGYGMGVAVGDVNADGTPDVLVTEYGKLRLFLNRGGKRGNFEEVTEGSGLSNPLWGASAAFFDYDRDGLLDLIVINYLDNDPNEKCLSPRGLRDFCGPTRFKGLPSKLFHNESKDGKVAFKDVSFESGIGRLAGKGFGVVCADFTGDQWPDCFVSNDGEPNRLWVNQRDGTFKDEAVTRGLAYNASGHAYAGMGVAVGDADNDMLLDLFVTHLETETNTLWSQIRPGLFRDRTRETKAVMTEWRGTGWGTVMADFDLDGDLDIAVANGRVYSGGDAKDTGLGFWETYADRNQLLMNDGSGNFTDISPSNPELCGIWNVARSLARGDIDGDGDQDLLITTIGGPARLYLNVAPAEGSHWLKVRANAYGAEVRLTAGGKKQLRVVNPAESFLASGSPLAHFGLGPLGSYEGIEVTWPDGSVEAFPGGEADRVVAVVKGEGGGAP